MGAFKRAVHTALAKESSGPPHMIVIARAGTGKTTSMVGGVKRMKGHQIPFEPSPQQLAVWEAMDMSKAEAKTICMVAFNKAIATELQQRVPPGCDAMTMHSMGFKAVTKMYGRVQVNSYRVQDIIAELYERDIRELRKTKQETINAIEDLVGLCKMNLVDATDLNEVADLSSYYDVDLNGNSAEIFGMVPRVLERCKDVQRDGCIDFNDMIWLPVTLNLSLFRYDMLLVDEAQDLNRCQQQLALKAGKRLVLCGDPRQAIYGFAGADCESMPRMYDVLNATPRQCIQLPLTVTRRCGKAIVREAQRIVPDFEAFDTNPEGMINDMLYAAKDGSANNYVSSVQDGDMCLCRVNAPLVSQCFRFIKMGRKANIQGRDVGQGLISTIKKQKATSVEELVGKLDDWFHAEHKKECAKRNPNENKLIALQDRLGCLMCFTEGCATVQAVVDKIDKVFTDDKTSPGIKLSSIHKAKGLEAKRVFLLMPKGGECPHPMARTEWAKEQERNLLYVAITRAIEELVYVR